MTLIKLQYLILIIFIRNIWKNLKKRFVIGIFSINPRNMYIKNLSNISKHYKLFKYFKIVLVSYKSNIYFSYTIAQTLKNWLFTFLKLSEKLWKLYIFRNIKLLQSFLFNVIIFYSHWIWVVLHHSRSQKNFFNGFLDFIFLIIYNFWCENFLSALSIFSDGKKHWTRDIVIRLPTPLFLLIRT